MQRHSSYLQMLAAQAASSFPGLNQGMRPDPRNPVTGVYGSGRVQYFSADGVFTIPAGCTKVRARGFGAHGTATADGGATSFGASFSITGGQAGNSVNGLGGVATGGDVNFNGGARNGLGGGACANVFGSGDRVGGTGGDSGRAGRNGMTGKGGDAEGATDVAAAGGNGDFGIAGVLDFIGTGGGGGGPSGGAAVPGGNGSNGGGGGAGVNAFGGAAGRGGFPGGGDGGPGAGVQGAGGGGFSLKEITGLTPGNTINVTVPPGALIAVEW